MEKSIVGTTFFDIQGINHTGAFPRSKNAGAGFYGETFFHKKKKRFAKNIDNYQFSVILYIRKTKKEEKGDQHYGKST